MVSIYCSLTVYEIWILNFISHYETEHLSLAIHQLESCLLYQLHDNNFLEQE